MKIHIICGSNSGNAFKAGEIIQSTLQNSLSDSKVLLVDAKDATQDDLACDFLIL
ncbi:MAG: hypothetical protein U9Q15_05005 [Patescibacteria group bacterium]|nr:hypothetical protein [Patescibacteria group bacterium]